ncbi:MAG: SDR family oxidoreductase [Anaerolineales bacterium]
MRKFQGQNVLITGGSSGIGLAAAGMLAQQGANVWLMARHPGRLQRALDEIRQQAPAQAERCGILSADVRDAHAVQQAIAHMRMQVGAVQLLINAAGVTRPGYAHQLPLQVYRDAMDVNYFGTLHTIQAILPDMLAQRTGHIVNISSLAGIFGVFGYAAYGASKFAVTGLSDVLRAELRWQGIRVSLVLPPDTDTPMLAEEMPYKPPETRALSATAGLLSPQRVAEEMLRGVSRGRYLILPGFESKSLYWLTRLLGSGQYGLMDFLVAQARKKLQTP